MDGGNAPTPPAGGTPTQTNFVDNAMNFLGLGNGEGLQATVKLEHSISDHTINKIMISTLVVVIAVAGLKFAGTLIGKLLK